MRVVAVGGSPGDPVGGCHSRFVAQVLRAVLVRPFRNRDMPNCASQRVLFVTAFQDTGRSTFARYKRSTENYGASFGALAAALDAYDHPLVVYTDSMLVGLPANTIMLPVANVSTLSLIHI